MGLWQQQSVSNLFSIITNGEDLNPLFFYIKNSAIFRDKFF